MPRATYQPGGQPRRGFERPDVPVDKAADKPSGSLRGPCVLRGLARNPFLLSQKRESRTTKNTKATKGCQERPIGRAAPAPTRLRAAGRSSRQGRGQTTGQPSWPLCPSWFSPKPLPPLQKRESRTTKNTKATKGWQERPISPAAPAPTRLRTAGRSSRQGRGQTTAKPSWFSPKGSAARKTGMSGKGSPTATGST